MPGVLCPNIYLRRSKLMVSSILAAIKATVVRLRLHFINVLKHLISGIDMCCHCHRLADTKHTRNKDTKHIH